MKDANLHEAVRPPVEEKNAPHISGMMMLLLNIFLCLVAIAGIVAVIVISNYRYAPGSTAIAIIMCFLYLVVIAPILFIGLKILKPNEGLVLTLFGKYYGTLRGEGFYFVNPFVTATHPDTQNAATGTIVQEKSQTSTKLSAQGVNLPSRTNKKISLKAMTLNNDKQKSTTN